MAIVPGKYDFYKQENGAGFYAGVGTSKEFAEKTETTKVALEIVQDGDKITMTSHYADKVTTTSFTLGQTFQDKMPNGLVLDSVATIEGNKIVIKSQKDGAKIGQRVYEFVGSEVIISMSSILTPAVCKRFYKKV